MSTRRLANPLFALVALLTCFSLAWSESPEPAVYIQPATIQANVGATVQISIEIQGVTNLGAFQFDLTCDPNIVQVDAIALGDFPGSTGRSVTPLGPRIEPGKAVYGAFSFGDTAGPAGSGTLAVATLKVRAGGQTSLGLQNVQVIDVGGTRISVSAEGGTMNVSGSPPAPERVPTAAQSELMRLATSTAGPGLPSPQASAAVAGAPDSMPVSWVTVAAVLAVVVILVVLVARRMIG